MQAPRRSMAPDTKSLLLLLLELDGALAMQLSHLLKPCRHLTDYDCKSILLR